MWWGFLKKSLLNSEVYCVIFVGSVIHHLSATFIEKVVMR